MAHLFDFELRIRGPEGQRTFGDAGKGLLRFARDLDSAISVRKINPIIQRVLRKHLDLVAEAMAQRHSTPWQPGVRLSTGKKAGKLAVRSGETVNRIRESVKVTSRGKIVTGQIGGPFYLVTHEDGKTISARNKSYMTIPLKGALDSRGVPLRPSLRMWNNTFLAPITRGKHAGKGFIVYHRKGLSVTSIYMLLKTVRIPPRLGMEQTLKVAEPALVEKVLNAITIAVAYKAVTGRDSPAGNF